MPETTFSMDFRLLLLHLLFKRQQIPELWMGLLTRMAGEAMELAMLRPFEPLANMGYTRQLIPASSWTITTNPPRAVCESVSWRNNSEERWPTIEAAFIATSNDDSGVLVVTAPLRAPRLLLPRDVLTVPFNFSFSF